MVFVTGAHAISNPPFVGRVLKAVIPVIPAILATAGCQVSGIRIGRVIGSLYPPLYYSATLIEQSVEALILNMKVIESWSFLL